MHVSISHLSSRSLSSRIVAAGSMVVWGWVGGNEGVLRSSLTVSKKILIWVLYDRARNGMPAWSARAPSSRQSTSRASRGRTGGRGRNHRAPAPGARGGGGRGRGASFGECTRRARGTKTVRGGPVDAGTTAKIGATHSTRYGDTPRAQGDRQHNPQILKSPEPLYSKACD